MHIKSASSWNEEQVTRFLKDAELPVRLAFSDANGLPRVCSLWYRYDYGALYCASHQNAYLVKQLQRNNKLSFEVSTNDYPYKGVRGQGMAELTRENAEQVLAGLIQKYLGNSNQQLASWLMSRVAEEYVIKVTLRAVNAWDFSSRMER